VYKILVGKPEGGSPLVSNGHKWEDEVRNDYSKVEWEFVDCVSSGSR
jgi:hypothetical protein